MLGLELENKNPPLNNLELDFILENSWDFVLEKLSQDMDPWNIDIVELANRYRSYINSVKSYNLKIPANFILICSILLRMKAEILFGEEKAGEEFIDFEEGPIEGECARDFFIPEIKIPVRRAPARKVTLEELKRALETASNIEENRRKRWEERKYDFGIRLKRRDIEEKLNGLFESLKGKLMGRKSIAFEELLREKNKKEVIEKFIQVLHLETNEKIECIQREFLGKLLIKLKKLKRRNNEG